jgi:hypothetical protein
MSLFLSDNSCFQAVFPGAGDVSLEASGFTVDVLVPEPQGVEASERMRLFLKSSRDCKTNLQKTRANNLFKPKAGNFST